MPLIPGYPKGSDLTVIDVRYSGKTKDEETGKWKDDFLNIIYRDNVTGEKKSCLKMKPKFTYYILKPEKVTNYHQFFVSKDDLIECECEYSKLKRDICDRLGLDRSIAYEGNSVLADNRVFEADIKIADFYRMKFNEEYTNDIITPTKSFLDIEVDGINIKGDFPEPGECPINAVSYLEFESKTITTVLLRNPENPLIEKFEKNLSNYDKEFKELLTQVLGGEEMVKKFELENLTTKIAFYDDEVSMLQDLFGYINSKKPDFILAWNMAFDIPFIIQRLKNLGVDAADIMCDPIVLGERKCSYYEDLLHKQQLEARGDFADISSTSNYLDQMIHFMSRRKGQSTFKNSKLDYIGEVVAGVRKLDYSDITTSVTKLPYLNYDIFVKYNMIDVIVQYCIEHKTGDIDYVFNKVLQNSTSYSKVHRQTVYLANRAVMLFKEYGNYVLGNNVNRFNEKDNTKYSGAFVANPTLISDKIKTKTTLGSNISLINNVIDYDYTRMYPSITQQANLAPNTQIGRLDIPNKVYKNENAIHNPKYVRSGAYIEDLTSDNYLVFANRWLHLANFNELYEDIVEYFNYNEIPYDRNFNAVGNHYDLPIAPVRYMGDDTLINPVQYMPYERNNTEFPGLPERIREDIKEIYNRGVLNVSRVDFDDD